MTIQPAKLALKEISVRFVSPDGKEDELDIGIDAGGVKRSWINLLIRELFDLRNGLFAVSSNKITVFIFK
jgi:hypothetical protein